MLRLEERPDGGEEPRILFARVDVAARDFDELLRRWRGLEQLASFFEGDHGVLGAVEKEDRRADPIDLQDRFERVADEEPDGKVGIAPRADRDEGRRRPFQLT